jgi:protein disulfide-isomerase
MRRGRLLGLAAILILTAGSISHAQTASPGRKWLLNYDQALLQAHKTHRAVMVYFSGSDWDAWTQKLDKDVLQTDMFLSWAEDNVVLLQVDFPHNHRTGLLKQQADRLRIKYGVGTVPSFAFLDSSGLPFARCGYDDLRLRDDERTEEPRMAIRFLTAILAHRPPDQKLVAQKDLPTAIAYARKNFISLLILVHQGNAPGPVQTRLDLLENQAFVKFVNRTMAFVDLPWPEDTDTSEATNEFRTLLAVNKVTPKPLQLLVWDMQTNKIKGRIGYINPEQSDSLIALIQNQLPRLDAPNGWIEDFALAQTIAAQQNRYVFVDFTSMDSSDWCQKLQSEILDTEEFTSYARKNLVLVRIDFPRTTTQPQGLRDQNQTLAELYGVRGFPTVIVLNPLGQKVSDAKYEKGGVDPFLAELEPVINKDTERRQMLKDSHAEEDTP